MRFINQGEAPGLEQQPGPESVCSQLIRALWSLSRTPVLNPAKGLKESKIVREHVLPNALIPVVTLGGLAYAQLLTGAVLTETVFSWPGMGRLFFDALTVRDYPILMGVLVLGAILIVIGNLVADLIYGLLDPRISYS